MFKLEFKIFLRKKLNYIKITPCLLVFYFLTIKIFEKMVIASERGEYEILVMKAFLK